MAAPSSKRMKLEHLANDMNNDSPPSIPGDNSDTSVELSKHEPGGGVPTEVSHSHPPRRKGKHSVMGETSSYGSADYNSNMFKLQAEEMLQKVRPTYEKRMAKVDAALRKIKEIIERIPDHGPFTMVEAEKEIMKKHKTGIPFPDPPPDNDARYTLSYAKPANVNVVGSYARKTIIHGKDQLTIDLAVTMPTKLFQEKDYLNYRYFYRRAYFLACIAAGIEESKDTKLEIKYAYQNDSHLQPVIVVRSSQGDGGYGFSRSKCQIRIILAADVDLFPLGKLLPDRNCLRTKTVRNSSEDVQEVSTPFYNASLRSECCSLSYLKFLHASSSQSGGFNDACVLGSVWLRQRGFGTGLTSGGFGPFEWASIVALLMQGGGPQGRPFLSKGYSSYQLFKGTILYLSISDLVQSPTVIGQEKTDVPGYEGPILFDSTRGINILFKMSPWSYALLRHESSRTLKLLDEPHADQFNVCFITKLDDPMQRFDRLASLSLHHDPEKPLQNTDAYDDVTRLCRKAYQVLKRGLDDRVLVLSFQQPMQAPWTTTMTRPGNCLTGTVLIGLILNLEHVNRTVDRGPSAEDTEAASSFRKFWGEKAELRRFKDGSILESLVWPTSSPQSILEQILALIIHRHLGDEAADSLKILGDSFDDVLPSDRVIDRLALYHPVMTAYEVLEKQIRALEGMPLQIRQVSAADPQLRYSSLRIPDPDSARSQRVLPANVYVQFEGSARWPDNLAAIQRTKIAFLLKTGELLEKCNANPALTTRLGLENQNNDLSNVAFLDINYSSGAFFRLRIHHERELFLLERALKGSHSANREAIADALSAYKRDFVQSPLHTQSVRTLSTRFPLLSPSMCLMKKWRDSHLLSHHISDELMELITIHTFVQPHPWAVPGSVRTGFLRTLAFISKWDWRSHPLIVDFSDEMRVADYDAINTRFEAWRKIDPAMDRIAVFVASNLDPEGIAWTEQGPLKVVAARLTSLARAACAVVKEQGVDVQADMLFAPSLADYDFILYLNRNVIRKDARRKAEKKSGFKNMQVHEQQDKSLHGLNLIDSFLDELRRLYRSNVLFFHDENGGSVIGGLWNPQTGPRAWKINVGYSTVPVKQTDEEGAQVTLNKAGTLHDIARLGGDLISKIEERQWSSHQHNVRALEP